MQYNYRYLQEYLLVRPTNFRSILITGPRRSGKSTFAKYIQAHWGGGSYVTFDTPLEQSRFKADPVGFFRSLKTPAVLDEIQNVPEAFSYLKVLLDEKPSAPCEYILTGSQQFQMMRRVTESLAGRVLVRELLPFSLGESMESPVARIRTNVEKILARNTELQLHENPAPSLSAVIRWLACGGFPQVVLAGEESQRIDWFNSYVETYVQRDVRALSNIQDLASFSRFVTLVAGRSAQIINYSELGKDIGVNYKTAQHYISLLESSFLWRSLAPYYKQGSEKRLSKSPKGIFLDTGLAMYLAGLHTSSFERNPLLGSFFETFVVSEFAKLLAAFGHRVNMCHFRAGNSAEVDLVLENGSTVIPIEIKCSASPDRTWGKGIQVLREVSGKKANEIGYVLSLSPKIEQIAPGVWNLPVSSLF